MKELYEKYKAYTPFAISIFCFLIIIIFSIYLYIDLKKLPKKSDENVEVSLPLIEWQKYSSLSKKNN